MIHDRLSTPVIEHVAACFDCSFKINNQDLNSLMLFLLFFFLSFFLFVLFSLLDYVCVRGKISELPQTLEHGQTSLTFI